MPGRTGSCPPRTNPPRGAAETEVQGAPRRLPGLSPAPNARRPRLERARPHAGPRLTAKHPRGLLRIVTDTDVRLWRRVHMDLVRYAGCVCHPSC
ncbi:putative leader peptide [Streptomyces sp. NPDC047123]|uniref:putative leader peptide n=1 Tax=Streptomyces sp. NPDC047123 TaxID=3155622 RepID=UPI0033F7ACCF